MTSKGQKEAVVEEVMLALPTFVKGKDVAILMLSNLQLELIKTNIMNGIIGGTIEYGKDPANVTEVRTYARSMTMNHLKKAKELNGGVTLSPSGVSSGGAVVRLRAKERTAPKGVNPDILPNDELKELAKSLV
jgi:hypothetical protein